MDRRLTAGIIARLDADILCLQEVFDPATLDHFHDAFPDADGHPPLSSSDMRAGKRRAWPERRG